MRKIFSILLVLLATPASADFALIHNGKVAQVASQEFPVSAPLFWVEIPPSSPTPQTGWLYEGDVFYDPTPLPAKPTVLTYSDFEGRFTQEELSGMAAIIYETDLATGKPKNPEILRQYNLGVAANRVDLKSPKMAEFLGVFEAAGILSAQRKAEILAP